MITEMEKNQKFQWKKGERFGEHVTKKTEDAEFTYFTDGSRIYTKVLHEFLEPFVDGSEPFPSVNKQVQQKESKNKTQVEPDSNDINSAMVNLIRKLSKNNEVEVNIELKVKLPKKEFVELFDTQEELNEVTDLISHEVLKEIEINKTDLLNSKILTLIKNYYGINS